MQEIDRVRPDKKKVVDEIWDDARVESFLAKAPLSPGENADFSALLYAYRSMRVEDFERFIVLFKAAGRDVGATDKQGRTVAEVIASNRQSQPFIELLG